MNTRLSYLLVLFVCLFSSVVSLPAQEPQKDFYSNGNVKSEINYSNGVREGEAKFYYENGSLEEERYYVNGRVEGLVKYYNEAGKLIEMANLENGKREGPTSIYDSTGAYLTDINYEAGKKIVETHPYYEQKPDTTQLAGSGVVKKVVKVVKRVKKPTDEMLPPVVEDAAFEPEEKFYLEVDVMPEPVGGMDKLQNKVHYPSAAKERGIQGTVKVQAFIDKNGEVKEANVVEGIGFGCDESARIAVYYTRFKPGFLKGKPVKVQMVIPIEFKLPGLN
jgi:TonB family protein